MENKSALIITGGAIFAEQFLNNWLNMCFETNIVGAEAKSKIIEEAASCQRDDLGVVIEQFKECYIIAADSGWDNAMLLKIKPDVVVGDLDSIKSIPDNVEIIKHPSEKDQTDTMLAIDYAISKGYRDITIIGGLSGRADHTLSTLFCLEYLFEKGISARVCDGMNMAEIVGSGNHNIWQCGYKYISILALDDSVVTFTGVKYPLDNASIKRSLPYAISNEITEDSCVLSVKSGRLFLIHSS